MSYNAKKIEEAKHEAPLPMDEIFNGIIIEVQDGKVKDFVRPSVLEKFENKESTAINLIIEVLVGEERKLINNFFTYIDEDGKTKFTKNSNLGKYVAKYEKAPEIGDQVKILSDSKGYGSVKIE